MHTDRDDEILRRHLLGTLPEEEAHHLDERLLADDELSELADAIEAELLDAYVRDELAGEERRQVAEIAATERGKARLAMARALTQAERSRGRVLVFVQRVVREHPVLLAASLAAVVAGAAYRNLFPPVAPVQAGEEVAANARLPELQPPPPPGWALEPDPPRPRTPARPALRVAAFVLSMISHRGAGEAEIERLEVPPGTDRIDLRLDLGDEPYDAFRAVIAGQEEEVWTSERLRRRDGHLVLEIPASTLPAGHYELFLKGLSPTGEAELAGFQELEIIRL